MRIIVDTREQKPLFKRGVIRRALKCGDYSTVNLERRFCIERKSMEDLYGSIINNHMRFRRMLLRAQELGIKLVIVVEGTKARFENKDFKGGKERKYPGKSALRIINTIEKKYCVPVYWCRSRAGAAKKVMELLISKEGRKVFSKVSKKQSPTRRR